MKALICGISGQDGAYLARLLVDKGYQVYGTSRDAQSASFASLRLLGLENKVTLKSLAPTDFRSVLQTMVTVDADEIYLLAGQSSVGLSFEQPMETLESISVGTQNFLEAIRFVGKPVRFYSAGSSECFGDADEPCNELTPFRPRSPYAVAKAAAFWQVANYREAYGLYACTGILFNHESPLRPERFVTRKIVAAACRIAAGQQQGLRLGNLDIHRDWGWAPDYVEAMWRMLQQPTADDFVIGTGRSHALRDFVAAAFAEFGLDWTQHVESDPTLMRPTDLRYGCADPRKALDRLGWQATVDFAGIIARLTGYERDRAAGHPPSLT
ncbi:GDP-mannose 4,6-dehydratase [Niveispirillum irakense]|uniref:GDP-mannose 4,6-dehydratase n=1 Tax=Niveispirillum irakense TaxID=34011 RepID=UPI00048ECA5E|nr:GDP-mannose 4,6-dehydratase [Niveispirillum irakense]